ncbi:MAG: ligase-associated DNA damage response DEXH box helicase [Phycisphaerales bacterium]
MKTLDAWFDSRGWAAHDFQRICWDAYLDGRSGLLHAPTGTGKTLAVWGGPVIEGEAEARVEGAPARDRASPIRCVWLTPLRALAGDTALSLREPIEAMGLPWTVEVRTGDTTQSLKKKQRERLPTVLVTTPESLTLILSYPDSRELLRTVRCVICDEWHELMSTKRGVQAELAIARLRRWNPDLRIWGLSATLGNLKEARDTLVGHAPAQRDAALITGHLPKQTHIVTALPDDMERFPWAGHLGTNLLGHVLDRIESSRSTLVFTNTRAQAEIWYRQIARARPDWLGTVALHHGSIDREVRERVEDGLRDGTLRCVVCTSSLDLGVDFTPVDTVVQVGSPKGIARLLQRAGRSGHAPGRTSEVLCVPAHAFELVEFAAAREGAAARAVESREPVRAPLDVLVQHLVTVGVGGGFVPADLFEEVRTTHAYRELTRTQFDWALDFVVKGGAALGAYPQYQRLGPDTQGRYLPSRENVVRLHRMAIGTITSDAAMAVRFANGKMLGTIEESFVTRLSPGDRFVFAGRVLELVHVRQMTATVKPTTRKSGIVPRWQGGRTPLSTLLSDRVRALIARAGEGVHEGPEMEAIRPILELQARWSVIPKTDEVLIETCTTRHGAHAFVFPFMGRLAHEGLGALLAHRLTRSRPLSVTITCNDYGVEVRTHRPLGLAEGDWRDLMSPENLLDDLLACVNSGQLARRRFRDIARIAGLLNPGFPGSGRSNRHLQASSELFYDVFEEFDPANLLIDQAKREVLEEQLEVERMRNVLRRIEGDRLVMVETERLTPLGFPLWAESLRAQHASSEAWSDRVQRMVLQLEEAARA